MSNRPSVVFFFFNDTATTEIYTLSLHDALPISEAGHRAHDHHAFHAEVQHARAFGVNFAQRRQRSEEHTSELQSPCNLVCRLLLEKKKQQTQDAPRLCMTTRSTDARLRTSQHMV